MVLVLTLTPTPPANALVPLAMVGRPQDVFPLEVVQCAACGHAQLAHVVDPKLLFEDYLYVSGTSATFVEHFRSYANALCTEASAPPGALAVDIGSNDGTLLRFFQDRGFRVLGVDPAHKIAQQATDDGLETWPHFFSHEVAGQILDRHGPATIVTANNVFAHVDDLAGFAEAVRSLLAGDGIFVFEVSYLLDVVEQILFDTIYHEHLSYHSLTPLISFFESHGLHVFGATRVPTHGGSLRVWVQHARGPRSRSSLVDELLRLEDATGLNQPEALVTFEARIARLGAELKDVLQAVIKSRGSIVGFGAPAKATTLMHHFKLTKDIVPLIVDDNPLKQGLFTPGFHIPVVEVATMYNSRPSHVLILAWNFADAIMRTHATFVADGGTFITPLPQVVTYPR